MAYFCSCHKLQSYHQYLAIAIQLIVASAHPAIVQAGSTTDDFFGSRFTGMLIMRMYALYERRRRVLGLYLGVALVVSAIGLVRYLPLHLIDIALCI